MTESTGLRKGCEDIVTHVRLYFAQQCWPPAFCLAMLYFTVLSFGILMTGYLKWSGMGNTEQSGFRALGALAGLMASIFFPFVMKHISLPTMGLCGIYSQVLCLLGMVVSRFVIPSMMGWSINEGANATLYVFTAFLALSRFGLWGFDLSVTQILQEQVPEEVIGTVNGVQGSLQEFMQIVMYCVTLLFTDPASFWILVSAAIGNVGLAAVIYSVWFAAAPLALDDGAELAAKDDQQGPPQCTEERDTYNTVGPTYNLVGVTDGPSGSSDGGTTQDHHDDKEKLNLLDADAVVSAQLTMHRDSSESDGLMQIETKS